MQEENRFFRFVWRLDAVLLALAAILVLGLLATFAIENLMRPRYREEPEGTFRPVPKGAEQNYTYRLEDQGDGPSLPHEKMLALRRWNGPPASYGLAMELRDSSSGYRNVDAVNLLVIDTQSGASKWLFGGYKRRILSQEAVYQGAPKQPAPLPAQSGSKTAIATAIALVLRTIDADTNKDGELDSKDVQSLYYFRSNNARAVKFFSAEYILSSGETDTGDYLIVYEQGREAFAATFEIPDFKLKSTQKLPEVPVK
jgi:hypothetical protein